MYIPNKWTDTWTACIYVMLGEGREAWKITGHMFCRA